MSEINFDDFDSLFDKFVDKKKAKKEKSIGKQNLESLPIWKEVKISEDYDTCLVCRLTIDDEDIVEPCGNCNRYYHYKHIREWFKIKANCPACKQ
ncbi:MAG: RING finger domain-containing protein [Candidatus Kariarchaeaceae archaeon]|jgi:hypothetical protein